VAVTELMTLNQLVLDTWSEKPKKRKEKRSIKSYKTILKTQIIIEFT
jgi:hypothetical protein